MGGFEASSDINKIVVKMSEEGHVISVATLDNFGVVSNIDNEYMIDLYVAFLGMTRGFYLQKETDEYDVWSRIPDSFIVRNILAITLMIKYAWKAIRGI